jgi:hypothetical protein
MSAKLVIPSALVLAFLSYGVAFAQGQVPPPSASKVAPETTGPTVPAADVSLAPSEQTPPSARPPMPAGLSNWITYARPDCCGPIGGNGPIKEELYLRTGPSLPVGGPIFGHVLTTGWEVQGGGRVLFFNPEGDRAWTADLSINSIWNGGQHADRTFPLYLLVPVPPAVAGAAPDTARAATQAFVRDLNRTSVDLTLGREWYLMGKAASCGCGQPSWRVGIDGGVGYGSEASNVHIMTIPGLPAIDTTNGNPLTVDTIRRRTDTIASALVALHTDVEIPCGCCIWQFGFRAEWAYTWSDILQRQNDSNMMDLNLLLTFGVRF